MNQAQEAARRRRVQRRGEVATLAANTIGAILAQAYFVIDGSVGLSQQGDDPAATTARTVTTIVMAIGGIGLLLLLGSLLGKRHERELRDWYFHPGERSRVPPIEVQAQALTGPIGAAVLSLAMWFLAGLIFGSTGSLSFRPEGAFLDVPNLIALTLTLTGLPGAISATLVYFINERIWQPEMPIFFPNGKLSEVPVFRMTVRRRVLVLFLIQAMPLLVLAVSAYRQATRIAHAENPIALLPQFLRLEGFVVGVGLLAALTLAMTLGRYLINSVEALNAKMALVRWGDLDAKLPATSNDEFGELAEGFNAMVDGLQQEEVVRRLFSLYVTPEVAEHAIEHGAALGGQLTPATVLFSDIRGFTTLTEHSNPETLIAMLNRYFQAMSSVIIHNGGFVNKFGGDSLLAVFGTPLNPLSDHANHAVIAAREMVHALEAFNADQATRGEPVVRFGIGIATGPVVAGNVGSHERLEYTVIGDTVNLASRLQTMTKTRNTEALISGATAAALHDTLGLVSAGEIEVRGKQQPVPVFTFAMSTPDQGALHA